MKKIPLMTPYVPETVVAAVTETLRTRWIGQGPKVEEFEKRFSEYIGRLAVAVGSCTDALHLAYLLAGIGPGDEVVVPLFTCTATNIPLLYLGAKIRFADVASGELNADYSTISPLINSKTKAVVVVHYGGAPVKGLNVLRATCRSRGVALIEDCAQAMGGTHLGDPLGSYGDFSCFSFQAVKHICTGDGGMLCINDTRRTGMWSVDLIEKAKRMRWFGIDRKAKLEGIWANDITEIGYKYQMTDIAAAMGIAGLRKLGYQMAHRQALRDVYTRGLPESVKLLDTDRGSACWLLTVVVDSRETLQKNLLAHGIESGQVHYRNDRYSIFSSFHNPKLHEFPNMDAIDSKYLVLPMHMGMTLDDAERVCEIIRHLV